MRAWLLFVPAFRLGHNALMQYSWHQCCAGCLVTFAKGLGVAAAHFAFSLQFADRNYVYCSMLNNTYKIVLKAREKNTNRS
jgi:hypothetical protein